MIKRELEERVLALETVLYDGVNISEDLLDPCYKLWTIRAKLILGDRAQSLVVRAARTKEFQS